MTEWFGRAAVTAGDLAFGWLLYLPSDAALALLALGSAILLVFVRKVTTDQDLLGRCAADKKRLRALLREAKAKTDREAITRLRATRSRVSILQLRAELRPLACLILPLAFLANWGWHRLEFHPPRPGERIELRATFPAAAIGDPVHLVPQEGLRATRGWIQPIARAERSRSSQGLARWTLEVGADAGTLPLVLRHHQRTFEWHWRFARTRFEPLLKQISDGAVQLEIVLRPVKLFGVMPGLGWLGLPSWLVGYLVLTLLFTALLKRWWKVN